MGSEVNESLIHLFLCGDVMTGRGIDQILPFPSEPSLHEHFMKNAIGYVELAEDAHGPIRRPKGFNYIWGSAIQQFEVEKPDLKIVNLETAITSSQDWEWKGINYRMNPQNIPCLVVAKIDCCALANNHTLDWSYAGLRDTLKTLKEAHIQAAGAGLSRKEAETPAILEVPRKGRVLVFSFGLESSGIPESWSATGSKPGVNFLEDLSHETIRKIRGQVVRFKKPNDIVIASIHWGGNWGYDVPQAQQYFAHSLIDEAFVDLIHGHSSHHAKAIEVYKNKLILYGCGDFLNDYEGISGYEEFRADLSLMYFPKVTPENGNLSSLKLVPMQMKNFCLNSIKPSDAQWLQNTLQREGRKFGTRFQLNSDHSLQLTRR
jgi:poly-gamma-glutamate capsule biosynthesis protein CapA/YwtB (metallophosphatase superfamily)